MIEGDYKPKKAASKLLTLSMRVIEVKITKTRVLVGLIAVAGLPGITLSDLSEILKTKNLESKRIMRNLIEKGLVRSETDSYKGAKGKKRFFLTEEGEELMFKEKNL